MVRIALVQQDFTVGDIDGNLRRIRAALDDARAQGARVAVFPELALAGYPPEDLLLRPGFMHQCREAVEALAAEVSGIDCVLGHPWLENDQRFNAVSWIRDGAVIGRYFKQKLPNYLVFDERRYFESGTEPLVVECAGVRMGVVICEDAWVPGPSRQARDAGAELLLIPNASPYREGKIATRVAMFETCHADAGLPAVYCNLVGGQDELVFDGRSMLMDGDGSLSPPAALAEDHLLVVEYDPAGRRFEPIHWPAAEDDVLEEVYTVLARGLRDYVIKNGFSDVVLGLSGGIDSALTVALAADALGADHVHAVAMPSRHTSSLSDDLARQQAELLGIDLHELSIEPAYEALLNTLEPHFTGRPPDVSEENLQARVRGNLVMALSNKFGWLPLATSNKSEMAVGYSTLYGDMCGGFAPIKDVLKTRVYALAKHRNRRSPAIPKAVITRAPSAELKPDQTDQDTLPPYDVLDEILRRYVEQDWSVQRIVDDGFDAETVARVARMVLMNEYKRRQGAPGTRVTARAFGRDRRYPITSGWREWH